MRAAECLMFSDAVWSSHQPRVTRSVGLIGCFKIVSNHKSRQQNEAKKWEIPQNKCDKGSRMIIKNNFNERLLI